MTSNGKQTETGKAFEYACVNELYNKFKSISAVEMIESPQLETARGFYSFMPSHEKEKYSLGAKAAIRIIQRLEPMLFDNETMLALALQTDSKGIAGDVRDVLCTRGGWQIGLSCKHNHEAVKHSRLSDTIDFGKEWFGKSCSKEYFDCVRAIFGKLRQMRSESLERDANNPALWADIPDKEDAYYVPVLEAFIAELKRLDREFPKEIPGLLIKYLIGNNDFYKVIMNDSRRYTQIETININGTLNKASGKVKSLVDVPLMKLPTKFYEIGFKEDSKNTIYVVCDQGWNVSMRIHNASSKIEPSLKFDVQLMAMPSSILVQIEPWD